MGGDGGDDATLCRPSSLSLSTLSPRAGLSLHILKRVAKVDGGRGGGGGGGGGNRMNDTKVP